MRMRSYLSTFIEEITAWDGVTAHPHRFGGVEWRIRRAELGHLHPDGTLDIPFTRQLHELLVKGGFAERHHWVPDSGWTTFRIRSAEELGSGRRLLRLSWLRHRSRVDDVTSGEEWSVELEALGFPHEINQVVRRG